MNVVVIEYMLLCKKNNVSKFLKKKNICFLSLTLEGAINHLNLVQKICDMFSSKNMKWMRINFNISFICLTLCYIL